MLQEVSTFFPGKVLKSCNLFFVLQELLNDASDPLSTWLDTKVQHFNRVLIQKVTQIVLEDTFSHNLFSSNSGTQCVVYGKEHVFEPKLNPVG